MAAQLRGFGPVGVLAILIILASTFVLGPFSGVLVLVWAAWSETPWREIGLVRPKRWVTGLALGVTLGALFKLFLKSIVMPLLGADPVNRTYHYLVGNRGAIPGTLFLLIVGAGIGEEVMYRGYMFERLGKLFGSSIAVKVFSVLLTATLFASAHYADQGLAGFEQAAFTGLAFGTAFAVTGRLWAVMCAHAAYDVTAYAIIYWDLETRVAHLVFR